MSNECKYPEHKYVGAGLPRVDGAAKVTGRAVYTADIKKPNMLHGRLLRSPVPHARIVNIDTSRARALPGVKAVITGDDTLKITYGNWRLFPATQDELPLKWGKVRCVGDEVAAVAAIDPDIAEEALHLIRVEYEELPAVYDVDAALAEGAPLIHDEIEGLRSNVSLDRKIDVGDVDAAFARCDYVREDTFRVHAVSHAYMEPCACVAETDHDGRVTLTTSTQTPYIVQCLLASTLGLPENHVRVIKPFVGGGFGGKMEMRPWEFCAAFLSLRLGRPVKFVISRQEELATGRRRHGMKLRSKIGFTKDGIIVAKEFEALLDGGAYNSMGPTATFLCGNFGAMLYRTPNYRYRGYHIYTNKPPAGAMRGFGAPQALYAAETQMNMAAEELGLDAIDLRLKNAMVTGDEIEGVGHHLVLRFCRIPGKGPRNVRVGRKAKESPAGQRHWNRLLLIHLRRRLQLVQHPVQLQRGRSPGVRRRHPAPFDHGLGHRPGFGHGAQADSGRRTGRDRGQDPHHFRRHGHDAQGRPGHLGQPRHADER